MSNKRNKIIALAILLTIAAFVGKSEEKNLTGVTITRFSNYIEVIVEPKEAAVSPSSWKLENGRQKELLALATNLFVQGVVNETKPIITSSHARIIISPGRSPLGVSFRENKCTGLLVYFQEFTPPLSHSCEGCRGEGEYPEYNICATQHKKDADFFSDTWRVYLEDWEMTEEPLRLRDESGKLLDYAK